jgi:hypothetical protein
MHLACPERCEGEREDREYEDTFHTHHSTYSITTGHHEKARLNQNSLPLFRKLLPFTNSLSELLGER